MIIGYFNSQPHEEADGRIMKSSWLHIHFNSQPHEEADESFIWVSCIRYISTHSLTKRLTAVKFIVKGAIIFQLTASRRGWQDGRKNYSITIAFQLTASRRGWRWVLAIRKQLYMISTHSLTKRLTAYLETMQSYSVEFQLTASRRGWHWRLIAMSLP